MECFLSELCTLQYKKQKAKRCDTFKIGKCLVLNAYLMKKLLWCLDVGHMAVLLIRLTLCERVQVFGMITSLKGCHYKYEYMTNGRL